MSSPIYITFYDCIEDGNGHYKTVMLRDDTLYSFKLFLLQQENKCRSLLNLRNVNHVHYTINTRSVNKKWKLSFTDIKLFHPDVICITETWLKINDDLASLSFDEQW